MSSKVQQITKRGEVTGKISSYVELPEYADSAIPKTLSMIQRQRLDKDRSEMDRKTQEGYQRSKEKRLNLDF